MLRAIYISINYKIWKSKFLKTKSNILEDFNLQTINPLLR